MRAVTSALPAGRCLVDAHRADDVVRRAQDAGGGDDRLGHAVDLVAVVAGEDRLLLAEHRAAQRVMPAPFPLRVRERDAILAGQEWPERQVGEHAHAVS